MKFLALAAVLALSLTGCGTVRALVGPDPALVAAEPTLKRGLGTDTAHFPEHKDENEKAGAALGDYTNPPPSPVPGILATILGILASPTGLTGIVAAGSAVAAVFANRKANVVAGTVNQHAELIDSVTPEAADFAAKVKTKAKPPVG